MMNFKKFEIFLGVVAAEFSDPKPE
jgi:hypothetical protein